MAENQNNNNNNQNAGGSNVVVSVASTLHNDARDLASGSKDIVMALIEALEKLFESIGQLGGSRNGVLANQIKELSNNIKEAAKNGEIRGEVLDELCNLTTEVNGKLNSLTPDKVEEVEQFVSQKTAELKNKYDNMTIDPKAHEGNFYDSVQKSCKDEKIKGMSADEFKKFFDENAKIFVDSETSKSKRYIKLGDEVFEANFTVKETDGKKSADLSVKALEDGSVLENETVKEVALEGSHPYTRVIVDLANENDMYSVAQARFAIAKEAETLFQQSNALQITQFFSQHRDKVQTYEEGRVEATFKKEDKCFYIRDRQSGEMLVFQPKPNGDYDIFAAGTRGGNTVGFKESSDTQRIGGWEYLNKTGKTSLEIRIPDSNIGALMASAAVKEFMGINGIDNKTLDSLLTSKSDRGSYAVSEKGMERVSQLKEAIEKRISDSPQTYGNVTTKNVTVKRGKGKSNATYLQMTDDKGGTMSFAFRSDGTPLSLSYKGKDDEKFKFMYNLVTHRITDDIWTLRNNDSVMNLLNLCRQSAEDLAVDMSKGEKSEGKVIEPVESAPSYNPFISVPNELQAKLNGQDCIFTPNRSMVYTPFTKDNIIPPETITMSGAGGAENAIFYALALETMGMRDKADECWKNAMETAVKSNHISVGNNAEVNLEQYKLLVREALSDPKDDFAFAGKYAEFLRSEESAAFAQKYAKASGLPFASNKKAVKAFEDSLKEIANDVEQGVKEVVPNSAVIGDFAILPVLAMTESGSIVYANDFSRRPLKFDEIAKVVDTVFNGATIMLSPDSKENEKDSYSNKELVEELRKAIKKEGTISKSGEITFKKPENALATQEMLCKLSKAMAGVYNDDMVKAYLDNCEGMDGQFIAPTEPKPVAEPTEPAQGQEQPTEPVQEQGQPAEPSAIGDGSEVPEYEGVDEPPAEYYEGYESYEDYEGYNADYQAVSNGGTFNFRENISASEQPAPAKEKPYTPVITQWDSHPEHTVSGLVKQAIETDDVKGWFGSEYSNIKGAVAAINEQEKQMSKEEFAASGLAEKREQLVQVGMTVANTYKYLAQHQAELDTAKAEYKENDGGMTACGVELAMNAKAYFEAENAKHGYAEQTVEATAPVVEATAEEKEVSEDEKETDAPVQENVEGQGQNGETYGEDDDPDLTDSMDDPDGKG